MSDLDRELIDVLLRIANRSNNTRMYAMLFEMRMARADFKFDLYDIQQMKSPIGFEGEPWTSDMERMFLKFRVKLGRLSHPQPPARQTARYDAESTAEEIVDLPAPRKELTRGEDRR